MEIASHSFSAWEGRYARRSRARRTEERIIWAPQAPDPVISIADALRKSFV